MLDIDNFKQMNDVYGHEAGDGVLQHFANLIKEAI
jgi:diguanylate cyclase (GGDEF)-like protein